MTENSQFQKEKQGLPPSRHPGRKELNIWCVFYVFIWSTLNKIWVPSFVWNCELISCLNLVYIFSCLVIFTITKGFLLISSYDSFWFVKVVGTQMRKKIEQLKEFVSEAEDVYKQMVITKGQITGRMEECFNSMQKIENSLLTLCGPDVADVLAKLKVRA